MRAVLLRKSWIALGPLFFFALASEALALQAPNWDWNRKSGGTGPDAQVPGAYWNLGPTGIRARQYELHLEAKYVFPGSPAAGKVNVGDKIVGVNGKRFTCRYNAKQGQGVTENEGPIYEVGMAIEDSEGGDGVLSFVVEREGSTKTIAVPIRKLGRYSSTFPYRCKKSDRLYDEICEHLEKTQLPNGDWGGVHVTATAALALLGSGKPEYAKNCKKAADYLKDINPTDPQGLNNWSMIYAGIYLSEYYLATRDESVLPTLRKVDQGLVFGHLGGGKFQHQKNWGGYEHLGIMVAQAVMAWSLMEKCGIKVSKDVYELTRAHLIDITASNGHVGYAPAKSDEVTNHGRTGAGVLGIYLSRRDPQDDQYIQTGCKYFNSSWALWPHCHASQSVAMTWSALAAALVPAEFRKLMDHQIWFLNISRSYEPGQYVSEPTRDGASTGDLITWWPRSYITASMGLILALKEHKLRITGGSKYILGVRESSLTALTKPAYKAIDKEDLGRAWTELGKAKQNANAGEEDLKVIQSLMTHVLKEAEGPLAQLKSLDQGPDVARLQEVLSQTRKTLAGVGPFDELAASIEASLLTDPRKAELQVGKQFYQLVDKELDTERKAKKPAGKGAALPGAAKEPKKPAPRVIKSFEEFAQKHPESFYGKAAAKIAARLESPPQDLDLENYLQQVRLEAPGINP